MNIRLDKPFYLFTAERDDKGYWQHVESYISDHSDVEFTHGMCPACSEKYYGEQEWYKKSKSKKNR